VPHALLVDDDSDAAETMAMLIANEGFTVATAGSLRDARRQIALQEPDIILLDLMLPDGSGMELFNDIKQIPNAELVLITGHASLDTSIQALRLGAADYLIKPMSLKQLQGVLSRVTKPSALKAAAGDLNAVLESTGHFAGLWGRSAYDQGILEDGDLEEGITAAEAVGDDRIQEQTQGRIDPESFTHGTSEQRRTWFRKGFDSGDINQCDTFSAEEI